MRKLNVLSLFDGISCGKIALDRTGINVNKYYASEIDKNAISVSKKNHPSIIHLGDVKRWRHWQIDLSKIDLLVGGSPCFVKGTLITTNNGYKNIEYIKMGDLVLTHKNRFRKVTELKISKSIDLYFLKIKNCPLSIVTGNHPYYVRREIKRNNNKTKTYTKKLTAPKWKNVRNLEDGDLIAVPIYNSTKQFNILKEDIVVDGFVWKPFYSRENVFLEEPQDVYNFEVEEDHSYVANDCVVHNCQGFSFAGKQLNFEDPRSKLFFEYVDILNHIKTHNPNVKFLLENVPMKKEFENVITKSLGVEPILINSSLFSAQNRKRQYWGNFLNGYDSSKTKDKNIFLKDIIHEYTDKKSIETLKFSSELMFTLLDQEVKRGKIKYLGKDCQLNKVYSIHNKSVTLCDEDGSNGLYLFGTLTPQFINKKFNGRRFNEGDKMFTLTSIGNHGVFLDGYIRKLSPIECERLQTLPDDYTKGIVNGKPLSNNQRLKMIGNAWTVDVISYLFDFLKWNQNTQK